MGSFVGILLFLGVVFILVWFLVTILAFLGIYKPSKRRHA